MAAAMAAALGSGRAVRLALLAAFAAGALVGWQAARARRRFLQWRKRRLQQRLEAAQEQLERLEAA